MEIILVVSNDVSYMHVRYHSKSDGLNTNHMNKIKRIVQMLIKELQDMHGKLYCQMCAWLLARSGAGHVAVLAGAGPGGARPKAICGLAWRYMSSANRMCCVCCGCLFKFVVTLARSHIIGFVLCVCLCLCVFAQCQFC